MQNGNPVTTPLVGHFRLLYALCPQSNKEVDYMSKVPYSNVLGSLMYTMVCSSPDLAYVVSRYLARNIGKQFSESCDTCVDSIVFVCSLVGLEMELQGMSILIMLEILIIRDLLQDTFSPLEVVLLVGKLLFSLQ